MKCPNCSTDNPEGSNECLQCGFVFAKWSAAASAAAKPETAPPRPRTQDEGPGLGQLLLLAAVLAAGWGAWKWMKARPAPEVDPAALLSPTPYRRELRALETVLYKDALPMSEDQQTLAKAAETLVQRLPPASGATARIQSFQSYVAGYGSGLVLPPNAREEWAAQWEKARAEAFTPAAWLHASASPQASESGPMETPEALLALQRSSKALGQLLEAASKESSGFGETAVAHDDAAAADKKRLAAWRDWVAGWLVRVDGAMQGLPPPDRLPAEVQDGGLLLQRVAMDLRAVPDPAPGGSADIYLPDQAARDAWLTGAGERLKQAETALQKKPAD